MKFFKIISQKKDIVSNMSWLFSDKLFRMGIGLVVSVWIARYLGPEMFGKWNYGLAITGIFSAIASLGLDSLVVRDLVNKKANEDTILGTSLALRTAGGCLAILFSLITILLTDPDDSVLHLIVFITSMSFLFQSFDVIDLFFQSQTKSKYVVVAKNLVFLICAVLRVIALVLKFDLLTFVLLSTIEITLGAVALIIVNYKKSILSIFNWNFNKDYAVPLLKECWPIIMSSVIIIIYMRIDQIMIKNYLDEKSVGIYSATVRISEVWYFIPSTITISLYPTLIKLREDTARYYASVKKMFTLLFIVSFIISLVTLFVSTQIIALLFGQDYIQAAFALKISIWTGIFVFWGVGAGNILVIENLNKHNLYKSLISVVLNVVLNIFLIPKYGINGAAVATLIAQAFGSYIYFMILPQTRHIFYLQTKSMLLKW